LPIIDVLERQSIVALAAIVTEKDQSQRAAQVLIKIKAALATGVEEHVKRFFIAAPINRLHPHLHRSGLRGNNTFGREMQISRVRPAFESLAELAALKFGFAFNARRHTLPIAPDAVRAVFKVERKRRARR